MTTQALFDIGNIILDPKPTFLRLRDKTVAWLPLLVILVLSVGILYWWVSTVDFAWLREHILATQPDAKPEAREAMRRFLRPTTMLWSSAIGTVAALLLGTAFMAIYYLIAGRLIGSPIGFDKWFGFSVWTGIPRLLTLPLSALQIVTSHGQLAPEDLNMVSLNYLLLHLPASNSWAGLTGNIDLAVLWGIGLATIGLKAWTGRTTATCAAIAILPYVIMYGLWAAKIVFFG